MEESWTAPGPGAPAGRSNILAPTTSNSHFQNAHDFAINGGNFSSVAGNQNITNILNSGSDLLRKASARGAAFNSVERYPPPKCITGTRENVTNAIAQWIFNPNGHALSWISGLAGSGKSAIAQTIAEFCAKRNILAASFFFARGNIERSTSRRLFTTIAYQLTISTPELKLPIHQALHNDPSIPDRIIHDQLQSLIIDPILSLNENPPRRRIIVIDALDECDDSRSVHDILSLLATTIRSHESLLQIIITSRPEIHIQTKFRDPQIDTITSRIALHHFDAHNDIRVFLTLRFKEIYENHYDIMQNVPRPWPADQDLERLVQQSSGLFIFAATIVKFIDNPYDLPNDRLKIALRSKGHSLRDSSPYTGLDDLYKQVLSAAGQYADPLPLVLGTIILLFDPLSLESIGHLLHIGSEYVQLALRPLYSVLLVPDTKFLPVRMLHESLRDFLTDNQRSGVYFVDPAKHHAQITCRCVRIMTTILKRDICHIADPSKLNSEVPDLPQKCDIHISMALRYACRYWAYHLCASRSLDDRIVGDLMKFALESMLYWIETLSLLGDLHRAIPSLQQCQEWLKSFPSPPADLLEILHDAERFVLKFFDTISASSLQVYYSALPFTPTGTHLRRAYSHHTSASVQVLSGLVERWDSCLRTIPCPADMISIAFSPDGVYLASGSNRGTIHIWDAVTGNVIATQDGQTTFVHSIAFSQNSKMLAFGCYSDHFSAGGLIGLWDIATGHARTIGNHRAAVTAVTFSVDDTRIASMSRDGVIMLWDVAECRLLSSFRGCRALSFCPTSGTLLSFEYRGGQLILWNTTTGEVVSTSEGNMDTICPMRMSTYVPWVASRSGPRSNISIWNFCGGAHRGQCNLDQSETLQWPPPLVLSPTGTLVACASDSSVQLWDVLTGKRLPDVCRGIVTEFQFSPNGARIASFHRHDKAIRLWEAPTENMMDKHASPNTSSQVLLPRSDAILVSASHIISYSTDDARVGLWDVNTGDFLRTGSFSENRGRLLAISPDGARLAWLVEENAVIEVWDVTLDTRLKTIRPFFNATSDSLIVHHTVFSETGQRIVIHFSSSEPVWATTLGLWDIEVGHEARILFSTDDFRAYESIWTIVFSRSGARIASLDAHRGFFWLWNTHGELLTRKCIQNSLGLVLNTGDGVFSSDDSLVTFAYPGFISLWDTSNGQCLAMLNISTQLRLSPLPWPMPFGFYAVGTHVYVVSTAGVTHIPSHFISSPRFSAIRHNSQHHYRVDDDGRIFDGVKRVCWVPTEHRPSISVWWRRQASHGHRLALVTEQHQLVVLDFTSFCNPCPYHQ